MGTNVLTDWTPALACLDRQKSTMKLFSLLNSQFNPECVLNACFRRGSKQSTRITLWLWWMGWGRYLSMTAPMMWSCPGNPCCSFLCSCPSSFASNGFAPGQIYPTAIPEILRVMRPGGYLLWTMREGYQQKSQRCLVVLK